MRKRAPPPAPAAPPARPAAPRRRRWLRRRPLLLEHKIAGALVLAAAVPFFAALVLARQLTQQNLALALNPRVVARLQATPALYGELFRARKQLYAEQTRALERQLPSDPRRLERWLGEAVARTPRLRRAAVVDGDGQPLAQAEAPRPDPDPEGEWRPAEASVPVSGAGRRGLPAGAALVCTFAVEASLFADLSEARDLAEVYGSADLLRADIQRGYLYAFAALLTTWALLAGGLGALLARRTTRRLSELERAARQLARGDLSVQVDAGDGRDEVAGLARAFNTMVREVRESRDRIVYLEKISGWQDVARRLAHEIKNPLTPIQLAFQQLEARYRQGPQDPAFAGLLGDAGDIVREEIATLQRLVEEFSGFAKLPDVKPEPAELGQFVEEFVRTSPQLAEEADFEIHRVADCPVALDRALMRRVLTNLARNAVAASRPARARVHLGVARTRERAVLTVADEGPGIPEELRERIFDPYFTTSREGTGLGLAIVKKIVLQHGGEIAVGARPDGGASFTITFPLTDLPPHAEKGHDAGH